MKTTPHFSELTLEDLADCAAIIDKTPLFEAYGVTGGMVQRLLEKTIIDPGSDLIAVKTEIGLAGFAWVLKKGAFGRSAYLRLIAMKPSSRGQGIGQLLLREIEARHRNPNGLFLLATETNSGARAFYEKASYRLIGIIRDYVKEGINECLYYKEPDRLTR